MRPQKVSLRLSPRSLPVSVDNSDSVGLTATRWLPMSFTKSQNRLILKCDALPRNMQTMGPEEGNRGSGLDAEDSVIQELAELLRVTDAPGTHPALPVSRKSHAPKSFFPKSPPIRRRTRKVISSQVSPTQSPVTSHSTRFLYIRTNHPAGNSPETYPVIRRLEIASRPGYKHLPM